MELERVQLLKINMSLITKSCRTDKATEIKAQKDKVMKGEKFIQESLHKQQSTLARSLVNKEARKIKPVAGINKYIKRKELGFQRTQRSLNGKELQKKKNAQHWGHF